MFKKISLVLASLVLSIGSGCVSAPNAANALTPDKAGCRKDAAPGDYVACLQVLAQARQVQGGGFAANGPAPAPTNTAPPVDQGSAPPPGGMPPGGPSGPGFGGSAPVGQGVNIAPACDRKNRRYQMEFNNVGGLATVPRGPWVICTDPRNLVLILVDGVAVPAIPPGATVMLGGVLPAMCFTEAGYGNYACRINQAEFVAYSLETVVPAGGMSAGAAPLSALWFGTWRPPVPYREVIGASAYVPHGGRPHEGHFMPDDRAFRRGAFLLLDVLEHSGQGEALKKLLPPGLVS